MANLEKHLKHPLEELEQADFSEVPTRGRSPHLVGQYIKNRQIADRNRPLPVEERPQAILLRIEATPPTTQNLERVRDRVRQLNRRLSAAGTPFRLRVV